MNRREMFKAIFGTAVAAAVPSSMAFLWREQTFVELLKAKIEATEKSMRDQIVERLYSDVTFKGVPITWGNPNAHYLWSESVMVVRRKRLTHGA